MVVCVCTVGVIKIKIMLGKYFINGGKKPQADHGEDNKIKILKYNLQVFLERGGSIREIT